MLLAVAFRSLRANGHGDDKDAPSSLPLCCRLQRGLSDSYLLAGPDVCSGDFVQFLEFRHGSVVTCCYLREGVSLSDSDILSPTALSRLLASLGAFRLA